MNTATITAATIRRKVSMEILYATREFGLRPRAFDHAACAGKRILAAISPHVSLSSNIRSF
jgi:hypothetical protein